MAKTDSVLQKHLSHPKLRNATYLSPQSQNEIINIIGNHKIRETILKEVRDAEFYAIMVDEVTSHNSEKLSVYVRYVDKANNVREEFLEFCYVKRTTGVEIATAIRTTLDSSRLPLANLRGQG